jgi:hypothetical protein
MIGISKSTLLVAGIIGVAGLAPADAAPWGTRNGWGAAAIGAYHGDPCWQWSPAEHRYVDACERDDRHSDEREIVPSRPKSR